MCHDVIREFFKNLVQIEILVTTGPPPSSVPRPLLSLSICGLDPCRYVIKEALSCRARLFVVSWSHAQTPKRDYSDRTDEWPKLTEGSEGEQTASQGFSLGWDEITNGGWQILIVILLWRVRPIESSLSVHFLRLGFFLRSSFSVHNCACFFSHPHPDDDSPQFVLVVVCGTTCRT